jgi:hypothetical protein
LSSIEGEKNLRFWTHLSPPIENRIAEPRIRKGLRAGDNAVPERSRRAQVPESGSR